MDPTLTNGCKQSLLTNGCKQSLLTNGCKQSLLTNGCKQSVLNPVFEQATIERERARALNMMRHRLMVESLYDEEQPRPSPEYEKVTALCKKVGVGLEVRAFMRGVYEDREIVEKLPAFHILLDQEWEMTVYTAADAEEGIYSITGCGLSKGARTSERPGFWSSLFARVLGKPREPQPRRRLRVLGSEGV